jgi:hypothetical protein
MLGVAGAAPRDGYSSQVATVQYPRASLYEGLPVDFFESVDELMQNRLAPSSMAKVDIAFERYWKPVAEENGWDEIIATDDPERGGKLATFVLRMLGDTALVADSIGTYVWALRWKMKLAHQADPALGVMHSFCTGRSSCAACASKRTSRMNLVGPYRCASSSRSSRPST